MTGAPTSSLTKTHTALKPWARGADCRSSLASKKVSSCLRGVGVICVCVRVAWSSVNGVMVREWLDVCEQVVHSRVLTCPWREAPR
jgi:hypothetical protein